MQRPLTGNHLACQLKKFFREEKIPFSAFNRTITVHWPNLKNFQPLTFQFNQHSIKIWNKLHITTIHYFEPTTITKLFQQLVQLEIIFPNQLPL